MTMCVSVCVCARARACVCVCAEWCTMFDLLLLVLLSHSSTNDASYRGPKESCEGRGGVHSRMCEVSWR
jgi:hypothetical protein